MDSGTGMSGIEFLQLPLVPAAGMPVVTDVGEPLESKGP